jgi:hypothetical protein
VKLIVTQLVKKFSVYFYKIHFSNIFLSSPVTSAWSLLFRFPHKNFVSTSLALWCVFCTLFVLWLISFEKFEAQLALSVA